MPACAYCRRSDGTHIDPAVEAVQHILDATRDGSMVRVAGTARTDASPAGRDGDRAMTLEQFRAKWSRAVPSGRRSAFVADLVALAAGERNLERRRLTTDDTALDAARTETLREIQCARLGARTTA